jgi:branched-subunit amino acid aminotransferase/4-amino-4-deoxychorismate lyase
MTHAYLLGSAGLIAGAGLPLTDRGFRYGMSIFETIGIREHAPLLLDAHFTKLADSAAAAKFQPHEGWEKVVRAKLLAPPICEGVARIYITAGDRDGAESRVALLFEETPIPTTLGSARAVTVEFTPVTPFGKTGCYWPHFLARPGSGEEAILCAPDGRLLGGAMANLFLTRNGRLLTPREPVRRGVVCDWVGGEEIDLMRDDLSRADAAFLTNSRIGALTLTHIDGRELPGDSLVEEIWQRYRAEVLRVR